MNRIRIRNIGPIKEVDFELNKINVLMGPQSCGKSTIAKIISFCRWVEKKYLLDGGFKYDVKEELLGFHRLSDPYFSRDSFFTYETDFIEIIYKGKKLTKSIREKQTEKNYKKSKNIYIPSERNFVSAIPNLGKYKETNDNIMSFVYDWFTAKRFFSNRNFLEILDLEVKFYHKQENDNDILLLKNKKEILLREGSSGLQSIIPLVVLIEYLTDYIFKSNLSISVEERDSLQDLFLKDIPKIFDISKKKGIDTTIAIDQLEYVDIKKFLLSYQKALLMEKYHFTNFIIEEPEQNLFPATQRELINYLFYKMNDTRDHTLLLTTHSPFVLYSINNCMMGYNIRDNVDNLSDTDITNQGFWINPDLVSIWQIHNGELKSVKDELTKTVTKHYFNEITKKIMDEYVDMLSYFEYDSKN